MEISSVVLVPLFNRQFIRGLHQSVPFDEHQIQNQSLSFDLNTHWLSLFVLLYNKDENAGETISSLERALIRPN